MKIYKNDGTSYETDDCEVITVNMEDIGSFINHNNGVKIIYKDGKEMFIDSAVVKEGTRRGIPFENIEIKLNSNFK